MTVGEELDDRPSRCETAKNKITSMLPRSETMSVAACVITERVRGQEYFKLPKLGARRGLDPP